MAEVWLVVLKNLKLLMTISLDLWTISKRNYFGVFFYMIGFNILNKQRFLPLVNLLSDRWVDINS